MEKQWEAMTTEERQEAMFDKWLNPEGVTYNSSQAEKDYKARVTRLKNIIQLRNRTGCR
jgi:hypothetical protein